MKASGLEFHPLSAERWTDFEGLFGERRGCGGCWCMWYRMKRSEYEKQKGSGNKTAMKQIVDSNHIPGILAYRNETPIGWCSIAPREEFSSLERSRVMKRVDDLPVWSIVCFFVEKSHRNQGISIDLLKAAIQYATSRGASIIEGYPVEPRKPEIAAVFASMGIASAFHKVGFVEVARRSSTRPFMRYIIPSGSPDA